MKNFILIFLLFSIPLSAETYHQSYDKGLLVTGDSTDYEQGYILACNNLVPSLTGELHSREGFSVLNSNPIDTFQIDNIFIYEPYPDTLRMIIVCNGFIYVCPTLVDPGAVNWDTLRMSRDGTGLTVYHGSQAVLADAPTWWYSYINAGDYLTVDGDSSDGEYEILTVTPQRDSTAVLANNYNGATTDTSYSIYKKIQGNASFRQEGSLLYVSDSKGFPFIYNDTTFWFLALMDSGMVDDVLEAGDSAMIYNTGTAKVRPNSNIVYGAQGANFGDSTIDVNMVFILYWYYWYQDIYYNGIFASTIIDIDSSLNNLRLADVLPNFGNRISIARDYFWRYEIAEDLRPCNFDADTIVVDGSKNWWDTQYGDGWLTNLHCCTYKGGVAYSHPIYCNNDSMFMINPSVSIDSGYYYYIFSYIPFRIGGDTQFPYFEQITFQNSQLLGFGSWHPDTISWSENSNFDNAINRIWYSETLIPTCIKNNYYFNLDPTENISTFFNLRDVLYCATNSSIWQITGLASTDVIDGDLSYSKIVDNLGIDDADNWCQATIEYIYFIDETGLYRFNGVRPEKFSYIVDDLIQHYWQSDCVMGYFNQQLYISFPDSDITVCYDESLNKFYTLNIGMTCFNPQSADINSDVFYFGDSDSLGYVCYYPNSAAVDSFPDTTLGFPIQLLTAKNSLYGLYNKEIKSTMKQLNYIVCDVNSDSTDSLEFSTRIDHASDPADTIIYLTNSSNHVWVSPISKIVGERFQFEIKSDYCTHRTIIRPFDVDGEWYYAKKQER